MFSRVLLGVLLAITFAVAFFTIQAGSLLLAVGAIVLGGFGLYGVMVRARQREPRPQ